MIPFLLKASIVLALLLLFYKLLLAKESFFAAHRVYLIGGLILVFSLPLMTIPQMIDQQGWVAELIDEHFNDQAASLKIPAELPAGLYPEQNQLSREDLAAAPVSALADSYRATSELKKEPSPLQPSLVQSNTEQSASGKGLWFWISAVYWFGVLVFTLRFLAQLISTIFQIRKSKDRIYDGKNVIINLDGETAPCSFFRYIFINPRSYDYDTYEQILAHERIHVQQLHSLDLILVELALIVLWFNPLVWMYRKEIEKNIEYQTDALLVQENKVEKEIYQLNLVKVASYNQPLSITTNYNQSLIKQRILKMNAKQSNLYSYWKYAFAAPLIFGMVLLLNKPVNALAPTEIIVMDQQGLNDNETAEELEIPITQHRDTETEASTDGADSADDADDMDSVLGIGKILRESASENAATFPVDKECKALINAVYKEDVAMVKSLLQKVDPDCVDHHPDEITHKVNGHRFTSHKSKTPLVVAAAKGNLEIAKLLVEAGADVNKHEKWDAAPLMGAAKSGNLELVKYLHGKGADVNKTQEHMGTALMAAGQGGNPAVADFLIAQGADVNATVAHVGTPLMMAAREGEMETVKALVAKGAKVDAAVAHVGTPMMVAAREGHLPVVKYLAEKGASLDQKVAHVGTPLMLAAREDREEVIAYLMDNGVDVNGYVDHVGSPLMLAAREGKTQMVGKLVAKGAEVDMHIAHVGTPLMMAAREGEMEVVKSLLAKGADINKHVAHVGNPLMVAAREGQQEVVEYLLAQGADINNHVAHVGTPLLVAARDGDLKMVEYLVAKGADLDKYVAHVGSPLIVASREGNMEVVKYLVSKGADVNLHVNHIGTALSAASNGQHRKIVDYLISKGAR